MGYEIKLIIGSLTMEYDMARLPNGNFAEAYEHMEFDGYYAYDSDEHRYNTVEHIGKYHGLLEIASVDLCKCGYNGAISKLDSDENTVKAYTEYGSDPMPKDLYGTDLRVHHISKVLDAIEEELIGSSYRRFKIAYGLLKPIAESFPDAVVLFYGH
jgi:hypothetical protein